MKEKINKIFDMIKGKLPEKLKPYTKVLIIGLIALLLIVLILFFVNTNSLNEYEKEGYDAAEYIKRNLKNPDSMVIYNDIVYIDDYLKDEEKTNYTFVNYGGTNSYGAMVSSTAIFIDGIYFSNTDAEKDDFDNIDDYVIYTKAKLVLASYNLVGSKSSDFSGVYIISGKKIANKLDVSYSEI